MDLEARGGTVRGRCGTGPVGRRKLAALV